MFMKMSFSYQADGLHFSDVIVKADSEQQAREWAFAHYFPVFAISDVWEEKPHDFKVEWFSRVSWYDAATAKVDIL